MNIRGATTKVFTSSVLNTVIGFLGITFFARELDPSQLGVFFLFQATLGMMAIVADFGLRGAVEKRISEGQPGGEVLTTSLVMKVAPFVAIAVVLMVFSATINRYVGAEVAWLLLVGLVLRELAETQQMVLHGEQRVGAAAAPDVARQVAWIGTGAVFVVNGYSAVGLIYGLFAGWIVLFLWCWHLSSTSFGRPSLERGRSLFAFSKYHVVSKFQGYIYSWMDVVIIGAFLTQADVGAYEVAWRITEAIVLLGNAIALTVLPQISRWHAEGQADRIGDLVSNAIVPSVILVIPAFGGALVLSDEILGLAFGPEYAVASLVFVILSGEKILQALYRLFHRALHGIDRPDLAARAIVVTLATNLLLNLLLVRPFGIEGIALGTTVSFALGASLHGRYLSRYVPLRLPVRELGWCAISTGVMTLGVWGASRTYSVGSLPSLSATIILGAVLYLALLATYGPLRERLRRNLRFALP